MQELSDMQFKWLARDFSDELERESAKKMQPRSVFKRLEFNCQLSHFHFNLKCSLVGALYFLGLVFVSSCVLAKTSCKTSDTNKDV